MRIAGVTFSVQIDDRRMITARRNGAVRGLTRHLGRASRARGTPVQDSNLEPPARTIDLRSLATDEARRLGERVNDITWYHSIDLPEGITTPGLTNHRPQVARYGLPEDMRGMRALDIATFDGFWAFEMERRGAEVVAIDIPRVYDADIPLRTLETLPADDNHATGTGFRLAHEALGSRVERCEMSVYDITPEALGTFDLVFMSDLLLHLRDPQRALERAYGVVRDGGHAIIAEPHNPEFDLLADTPIQQLVGYDRYVWAIPSSALLKRMLNVAGFSQLDELARFRLNYRGTFPLEKIVLRAYPWQRHRHASNGASSATALVGR